ncbi:tryptophan--tRNA ligase [Candidatus Kaiserbacteria bacterium]|nr:tryptophan--tRNA ligase [Candidatus Kaiserbacteria bacterium]USN92036.1 MAG: tryptophan--tRNA ligase [Candidatus Nomurabacteria bacterium]
MSTEIKRLLTGLQPSGNLHIGNYFGALKPFLDIYENYESYLMVADYHALTSLRDPESLRRNTLNIVRDYLAVGLDPDKVVIFRQSDNQDHMELAWILNCMVTVPFLQQAHSYKDKLAKELEPNVGLFTYPMLQASDIVLYNTDLVPVGEDQRQHIEYTREAVGKFNRTFGETLKAPQEMILKSVGIIPGTDGEKMSKSYKNTIPLFGTTSEIEKAVMSIVTDSQGERPENVYAIHKLFRQEKELESIYDENRGRYGDSKKLLIADIEKFISPLREKRSLITDEDVKEVLKSGAEKAKSVSSKTLATVRKAIGID